MTNEAKPFGQILYEADLVRRPNYHDGAPRKQWHELDSLMQWSWNSGQVGERINPQDYQEAS